MYVHKQKPKTFKLGTTIVKSTEDRYLPKPTKISTNNDNYLNSSLNNLPGELKDAETNEPLELSRATWNVREGRLSLNAKTILNMGTGRLDIHQRIATQNNDMVISDGLNIELESLDLTSPSSSSPHYSLSSSNYQNSDNYNNVMKHSHSKLESELDRNSSKRALSKISTYNGDKINPLSNTTNSGNSIKKDNDLIKLFLKRGPLTPMFHVGWNPRGNKVELSHLEEQSVVIQPSSSCNEVDIDNNSENINANMKQTSDQQSIMISASVDRNIQIATPTSSMIASSIELANLRNWAAIEEKEFQELYNIGYHIEMNKSLTKELHMKGGLWEVRTTARKLARLKVNSMKQLVQACLDEELKDKKRCTLEDENANKPEQLKDMLKTHNEERKIARRYIDALEYDNEIILIRNLNSVGWLW